MTDSSPQPSESSSSESRKNSRGRPASIVIETLGAKTSETEDGLRKINQYLLKKEIGRGAFGVVHLGVDTNTGIEYVRTQATKTQSLHISNRCAIGYQRVQQVSSSTQRTVGHAEETQP